MNDLTVTTPLYSMTDLEQMARVMSQSRMFGFKSPEEAVSLMLMAQAEGKHPAKAAQEYHVIQGRPALKADAMLARFQSAGGVVEWEELTDTSVSAHFSHPKSCPKPVLVDWTMERAKSAGLTGKDNWRKYPRQMLKARVISEGVRMTFPGVTVGLYTPEEVMQFDDEKQTPFMKKAAQNLEDWKEGRESEVLSATVVGSDVQHASKTDAIASEVGATLYNGKEKGDIDSLLLSIGKCGTPKSAKSVVTRSLNKYAYTKRERDEVGVALEDHIEYLESLPHDVVEAAPN